MQNNRQSNLIPATHQGPQGSHLSRPAQLYGAGTTSSQLGNVGSARPGAHGVSTHSPQSPQHQHVSRTVMLQSANSNSHQSTGKTGNYQAPHHQKESTMISAFNNILKQLPQSHQNNKNMMMIASPLQQTQCDLNECEDHTNGAHKFGLGTALGLKKSQQPQQPQQRYEVYMRCVTWGRDSHGLFDYESRQIAKRNIKSYTGGKIIRLNNDVEFISRQSSASEYGSEAKPLIIVHEKNGKFFVENDTLVPIKHEEGTGAGPQPPQQFDEDVNNKMFIVVRNLKSSTSKTDYKLKKGDIIKLGRIKFKVKDYRTELCQANIDGKKAMSPSPFEKGKGTGYQEEEYWVGGDDFSEEAIEIDCGVVDATQSDIQCKVCWSNEQSNSNPLLNSCKCDGSVRFIHYECLKHWLKQKMQKKEESNLISYSWKQFECEICKKPYPYIFKSNGRKYRLVDVEVPEDRKFLWLESLTFEKNSSRMVHLIMPDEQHPSFKLGRGHESDVRVSDISVSRCHALLKYDQVEHCYYLEDNLSKFGTLVLAKQAIELDVNQTQAVQIGRSVISFTVKPMSFNPQKLQSPREIEQLEEVNVKSRIEEAQNKLNKIISQTAVVQRENYEPIGPRPAQNHPSDLRQPNIQLPSSAVNGILEDPNYYEILFQQSTLQQQQLQDIARQVESLDHRQATRQIGTIQSASHALQYSSPQRQVRGTIPQLESPLDDLDEENMRTQYKPSRGAVNYLHSGRSHAKPSQQQQHTQLLAHPDFMNTEYNNQANSPFLPTSQQKHVVSHFSHQQQSSIPHFSYQAADKPSISFQQPQCKSSTHKQTGRSSAFGHATRSNNQQQLMYSFEDLKEELSYNGCDRENEGSMLVPAEEIEEEAPLRIRTIQYEQEGSSQREKVISIDLNKYIKQHTTTTTQQYQSQQASNYEFASDTYSNLRELLAQVTDHDLRRELEEVGQHQIYLMQQSTSPRRMSSMNETGNNTGSKRTAVGSHNTQDPGQSNNFTGVYSHWQNLQSQVKKQQQNTLSSGSQQANAGRSSDKYNISHQKYVDYSRATGIQQANTQMNSGNSSSNGLGYYNNRATSSQSPWRMLVAEAVDAVDRYDQQACVITPVKDSKKAQASIYPYPHASQKQAVARPQTAAPYSGHSGQSPTKNPGHMNSQAVYGNAGHFTPSKVGKSSAATRDQLSGSRGTAQKVTTSGNSGMGGYYNTAQKRRQQQQQSSSKAAQPLTFSAAAPQTLSQYPAGGVNQQNAISPFSKQSLQNHREQQQHYSHQQEKLTSNNNNTNNHVQQGRY